MAHIVEGVLPLTSGSLNSAIKSIIDSPSVLGKETKRGSDYRKATLLILQAMQQHSTDHKLTMLFASAAEIQEIVYAREDRKSDQSILRLHNLTFIHGKLCNQLFPKSDKKSQLYGNYFHSLMCHAPQLYRVISLRSINTEYQERMFKQANSITKATSNMHPTNVITNVLIRVQEESRLNAHNDPLQQEESTIGELAKVLDTLPNTFIPSEWMEKQATQYQAHLERIADFLLEGPNRWWVHREGGIEFLDKTNGRAPSYSLTDHYRSTSLAEVYLKLQHCWEKCFQEKVELPAVEVKHYTSEGSPDYTTTYCTSHTNQEKDGQSTDVQCPPKDTPNTSIDKCNTPDTETTPIQRTNQETPAHFPVCTDSSQIKSTNEQSRFQTTIGSTLIKMLPGEHRAIGQLDKLRSRIKRIKTKTQPPQYLRSQYAKIVKELKVKVEKWYQHAIENKANPPPKESHEEYIRFQREQRLLHNAKTILREFKITL